MAIEDKRITKLRAYLIGVLDGLVQNSKYSLNANNLDNEPNSYSLDKIPMQKTITKWVIGTKIQRDVYSFRSRKTYSQATIENLKKLDWKSVYVFDGNKTSFNILVPADNTSTSSNIRITLVKVE